MRANNRLKRKMPTSNKVILFISIIFITACMAAIGAVSFLNSSPLKSGDEKDIIDKQATDDNVINFLVLGMDESGIRPDVLMVVSIDPANGSVNILQIPRDTFVGDNVVTTKINAVYDHPPKDKSGIGGMIDLIQKQYKLYIDHYLTVKLDGFRKVVDAIGGVDVDLPQTIEYSQGEVLYKGPQTLNGEKAEWFIRHRNSYASGDIGRMEAHQIFLSGLAKKLLSLGSADKVSVLNKIYGDISTDLSIGDAINLSSLTTDLSLDNVHEYIIPGEPGMYDTGSTGELSVYFPYDEDMAVLLNMVFRPHSKPVLLNELNIPTKNNPSSYKDGKNSSSSNNSSSKKPSNSHKADSSTSHQTSKPSSNPSSNVTSKQPSSSSNPQSESSE